MPALDKANPADVDIEQVKKMVDRYPRGGFTLATKLHAGFFDTLEDRDKVFSSQLEKTGAGFFDYYLLHGIEGSSLSKYEQFGCFNWRLQKKEKDLVKHAGFSYHDSAELLDEILNKHPEMEFVQLPIIENLKAVSTHFDH